MKLEFYETKRASTDTGRVIHEHRWRVVADNGGIIAASTEGFYSHYSAERNYELARQWFINGSPEVLPGEVKALRAVR